MTLELYPKQQDTERLEDRQIKRQARKEGSLGERKRTRGKEKGNKC